MGRRARVLERVYLPPMGHDSGTAARIRQQLRGRPIQASTGVRSGGARSRESGGAAPTGAPDRSRSRRDPRYGRQRRGGCCAR